MKAIGIDLNSDIVNLSVMSKNKDLINIKSLDISDILNRDVKKLYISNKDNYLITSALDASDVLIKSCDINVKNSFFIKKTIKFHEESISNLDADKTIISTVNLKNDSKLKFFITTKQMLSKHLSRLKNLNIDPDRVTSTSQALIRFVNYYFKGIKSSFIIHIAKSKTTCLLMKDNQPIKTYNIKIGTNKLLSSLEGDKISKSSKINILTLSSKNKLKIEMNHLKKEIEKVFTYFCKSNEEKYPLIVTGDINYFIDISEFLKNNKVTEILKSPLLEKKVEYNKFAICIGLSLDALKKDGLTLQFRKGEYTPSKKIGNIGKKILFLTFFVIVFCTLIHFGSNYFLKEKENTLHQRLSFIINAENSYLDVQKKDIYNNFYDNLDAFEKKLIAENKNFPYILNSPSVSETLNWLNNHEFLKDIEITFFNYVLEKFPTAFTKNDPYLAKIDLEIKTDKPTLARDFYDSLSKTEGLVDQTRKISWKVIEDRYKATFYLKNKKNTSK